MAGRAPETALPRHLSPASIARELDAITSLEFSPTVREWIEAYAAVGPRNEYLWRWCRHGLELITLSCVEPELRDDVCDTKLLNTMLGVLLDDVADGSFASARTSCKHPEWARPRPTALRRSDALLEVLLATVSGDGPASYDLLVPQERAYAAFTRDLWSVCCERLARYPCFKAYEALLRYDYAQVLNAMRYARLVNEHVYLLNPTEHDLYQPHNMQIMSFATMDLMCSPGFLATELGKLRQAMWHAQYMGRIGNLVTTWEREIADRDFTSGVFAHALVNDDLTVEQLADGDRRPIEAAIRRGGHEAFFLRRWQYHRRRLLSMRRQFQSVSLDRLIDGLGRLLCMEWGSRGLR